MTAKRLCPVCNLRVIKTPKARRCQKCGRLEFKRVKEEIRERHLQAKRRKES